MARPFSLQLLLEHSLHRMEAAERLLRMLGRKEDAARQRLREIQGYKREYQERMVGAGEQGMAIHRLRDYHAFLLKVDQAIQHQESEVAKAHEHWAVAHGKWLELRRQVKAYEVLAQRHRNETLRLEERRDQRVTDESAAQKHHPLGGRSFS